MIKKIIILFLTFIVFFVPFAIADDKYLSLKKNKVNVRYGPSFDSGIKYIYKVINLPVKQIDKKENFRRIIDLKNNSGWIHVSQLREKSNSLIVLKNKILFTSPSKFSKPIARIEKGRLLVIKKCSNNWCKIKSENFTGWLKTNDVWGYTK
jgi:SH3-like domain-containing protein